ncbi:MAG: zinc ABC transporter substrate-binding protein [Desulfovibrio sp.]|uniref:metal ABC transporter substrate-binding protein n=1 Tax=Desulfovibrio sp. TaxID=885 RepID=UPI001A72EBE3|nr:metal ABC transporter substrate-binding protein [Desulfovibrio sp.]MBD5417743.1 zinc ABC transporter substrate-binding protein [Desulfovibrio sp.]
MKRLFSFLRRGFCALACLLALAPCAGARAAEAAPASAGEFRVLATTFPVWLFTRNVCHEVNGVRVELFVPAQTGCPHEFTPSPADLRKLAAAQAIVINGLGLEAFLSQPLRTLDKEHAVIDASRGTDPLPAPAEAGHGHDDGHDHAHDHGAPGINPHIFAGPAQAALMARAIGEGLARLDPPHAEAYRANAAAFAARLEGLAGPLAAIGKAAPHKGIVLQHDDLAYLAHEASLETLAVLRAGDENSALSASQLNSLTRRLKAEAPVLIAGEPPAPDRAVELLSVESGVPFALLDPVASGPADAPLDYYERAMRANAETLRRYFDVP